MTVHQLLLQYRQLYRRRQKKLERYLRLSERAAAPRSAGALNKIPTKKKDPHAHEELIIKAAEALDEFYKIDNLYYQLDELMKKAFRQMPPGEGSALECVYKENALRKSTDQFTGVCRRLDLRKKTEIPAAMRKCESDLADALRKMGVSLDD